MPLSGFDTGSSGGGGTTSINRRANRLSDPKNRFERSLTGARNRGEVQSANWTCPIGSFLTYEANGSGNLVCQNTATGQQTAAVRSSGDASVTGSGGTDAASTAAASLASAISGGGGGGGGAATTGTTRASGAAANYLQAGADTFARNPEAMLADQLVRRYGPEKGNGLYEMLRPYGEAANVLFLAHNGQSAETGEKDDFLNYLDNYWTQLQTPGARIDHASAIRNIMNPAEGSPLRSYLTSGLPEDQAKNLLRLMAGVTQTGYHPLIGNAIMDRLGIEADRYMGASARGQVDPFYQTLGTSIPGLPRLVPYK